MNKTLQLACLAILAFAVTGCGKRGQVPEKTILAAYFDLEQAYRNGKDLVKEFTGNRTPILKGLEDSLKEIDTYKDALHPEWAVIAYGRDLKSIAAPSRQYIAVTVKVEANEATVADFLKKDGVEMKTDRREDGVVFSLGPKFVGLIDNTYLVASPSKDAFEAMFDLYAGKSKASRDFGDLTRIPRGALCRIATAPVSRLLAQLELAEDVERFGQACEDYDLADMVLCLGAASVDVWADNKDVSLLLRVSCGSSGDARVLDHFFQSIAFSARVACDISAYAAVAPDRFGHLARTVGKAQNAFIELAHAIEAERDGNIATLSCTLSTDKLAELFGKAVAPGT